MKPCNLKLVGFTGIASGQGKESIYWDLEQIPSDAMLVAITGGNGVGKTTLMDNLHPYRVMPSRSTSNSPGGFSYYDNMSGQTATKELVWEHDGVRYKTIISLKSTGKTRKQEAFLLCQNGAEFTPYVSPAGVASDGKTDVYDSCIEGILGSPEVFFSTAFSSQRKRPISAMTTSEVKALLSSMLGTENLKALSEQAADVAKCLRPHLESLKAQGYPSQQRVAKEPQKIIEKANLLKQAREVARLVFEAETEVSTLSEALGKAKALMESQVSQSAIRQSIEERLRASRAASEKMLAGLMAQQNQNRAATELRLTETTSAKNLAVLECSAISERLASTRLTAAKLDATVHARAEQTRLQSEISAIRCKVEELAEAIQPLTDLRLESTRLVEALAMSKTNGSALAAVVASATATAALIGKVPCKGTSMQGACSLLAQANEAHLSLPINEHKLADMRKGHLTLKQNSAVTTNVLEALLVKETELAEKRTALNSLEERLGTAKETAAMHLTCKEAADQVSAIAMHHEEARQRVAKAAEIIVSVELQLSGFNRRDIRERTDAEHAATQQLVELETQLKNLPVLVTSDGIEMAETHLKAARDRLGHHRSGESTLAGDLSKVSSELELISEAKEFLRQMEDKSCGISDEISQWCLLSKAFGNDGVIALAIDDAGPAISLLANRLLDECYGGRFSVRLETQKTSATGIVKEGFEIIVNDAQRGEEKCVDVMSGGEMVWVNECVVRAFSLYMTKANGKHFDTVFSDECDGALDPERKRQFMRMKKAVLLAGGYQREFLVTQTPELWSMADHVVDVSKL